MVGSQPRFWNLRAPDMDEEFRVDWEVGKVDLQQVACPINAKHRRGGRRTKNLRVVLGSIEVFDVMWTWVNECLIQQHVLDAFEQQGFSGFQVKPVEARFKRPGADKPPRLWEFVVTGWAGFASPESGMRLDETRSCLHCGSLHYTRPTDYSRLIDETKWDGSDFFMVWPLPKYIFVTDRVREFAQTNGFRLVEFAHVADLQDPFLQQLKSGPSPGRLSYWMPEDRARELGEPLGIY